MSDRYLFRGKRKDNMEWVYGSFVKSKYDSYIFEQEFGIALDDDYYEGSYGYSPGSENFHIFGKHEVISETVGQWTGFFDKKKTPIYDSDYLRQRKNKGAKFLVYWDKDGAWRVKSLDKNGFEDNDFLWRWNKNAIVVGNKFNPELLEGA